MFWRPTGELPLIAVFVVAIGAALVLGAVARRLRQPAMVGYIIAGVLLGPSVLGIIADGTQVTLLAQFGIAFLMFALGTQFPLAQLRRSYGRAMVAAFLQVVVTIAVIVVGGWVFGFSLVEAALLGVLISCAGDVVIIKVLSEHGELNTAHGRLAIAITLMQDLVVIPLVIVLPHMGEPLPRLAVAMAAGIVPALAFLVVAYAAGKRVLPWTLQHVAQAGRELFLLAVIFIAVGAALLVERFGLSFAIGAYFAGVIVAESDYDRQALSEIVPFRDIFTTFFFVGVGLIVDVRYVISHPFIILAVVPGFILGKTVVNALVTWFLRYPVKASILSGLLLANIGEAAFLLAQIAYQRGAIPRETYTQIIAGGLLSTILSPLLFIGCGAVLRWIERFRPLDRPKERQAFGAFAEDRYGWEMWLTDHVILCGGADGVSRQIADTLRAHNVPYVLVEPDPARVAELQNEEVPVVFGDPANPAVLSQARVHRARMMVISSGDFMSTKAIVKAARGINPRIDLVVPWPDGIASSDVLKLGVPKVVRPEFEMSQEYVRHIMGSYGFDSGQLIHLLEVRRTEGVQPGMFHGKWTMPAEEDTQGDGQRANGHNGNGAKVNGKNGKRAMNGKNGTNGKARTSEPARKPRPLARPASTAKPALEPEDEESMSAPETPDLEDEAPKPSGRRRAAQGGVHPFKQGRLFAD